MTNLFSKLRHKKSLNKISRKNEYLISEETPFNITEAFRNLKASLTVSIPKNQEGKGTAVLMTSAFPEDGKSTVSTNLALMLAMSDYKVVLVDADIRKGRVAKFFRHRTSFGLADYLSGQKTLEEVTHVAPQNENLSYISCGTHSPRPYELLESEEMKKLIDTLRGMYDYVIIDSPPLLLVSDALAIANQVDGTVLVCRHQASYVNDVKTALAKLNFIKCNVLGIVVNDYFSKEKMYSRNNRYKYYSYAYHYGASKSQEEQGQ
jgi:capsular exopolysaccharide synthesis family protein